MVNRRNFIGGSLSGFFAYALRNQMSHVLAGPPLGSERGGNHKRLSQRPMATAKRCVVLWMEGGPSQIDTFDPKPGAPTGGPFRSIGTTASDIQISEHLPRIAQQMEHLSVIRNLTSNEGEHVRARYEWHTGFKFAPSFPRPALGSVISHETERSDLPKYVSLGSPGFGPAYLGPAHAPFSVDDPARACDLLQKIRRRRNQLQLLSELDQPFVERLDDLRLQQRSANLTKIQTIASTSLADVLDIESYSRRDQNRYGSSEFGQRCLIARKLLELGVSFVEVQLRGWDTHQNNFQSVQRLSQALDRPFAALIEDLRDNGLFDDTVVLWMGEFGRTPTINATEGRDHFPRCTPVVIGGGPLQTGVAVGATSSSGREIEGKSYQVADLFATILHTFGVAPDREFQTAFDSPTTATDGGNVIEELMI